MVRVTPATARCLAECESASANSIEDTPISWLGCAFRFPSDFRSEVQTSVNSTVERFVAFGPVSSFTPRTPSFRGRFPQTRRRARTRRARDCESRLRAPGSNAVLDTRPRAHCFQPSPRRPRGSSRPNPTRRENTRFADRAALVQCKPRPLPRSFHKPRRRDGRSGNAREDVSRRGATWCVTVPGFSTRAFCSRIRQSRIAHAPRRPRVAFRPNRVFFHSSLGSALTATTFPRRDAGEAPTLARARGGRV